MESSIKLTIQKNIICKGSRVGDYLYDKDTDTIFYELPYPFPCKFAVKGLKEITLTPMMLRLPHFLKYHNIDWLRQQLMQIKLIQQGAVLLHGAAWQKDGIGYLAVGFANSGKTTRVLREVSRNYGRAKFCADENVIVAQDGLILPVYRPSCLNWRHFRDNGLPMSLRVKMRLFWARLRSWFCPLFEPNIFIDLPYLRHSFKLNRLIYLTEGQGKSLTLLTDNEFPFYTNPVIQAYAYAAGWDLEGLYRKYRELLREVENVDILDRL